MIAFGFKDTAHSFSDDFLVINNKDIMRVLFLLACFHHLTVEKIAIALFPLEANFKLPFKRWKYMKMAIVCQEKRFNNKQLC